MSRSPRKLLAIAVARVRADIEAVYSPLAPGGPSRAEGYLRTLEEKLHQVLDGRDPGELRAWLARSPLFEPLMRAVGEQLLHGPDDPDSAHATLVALRAWSALRPTPDQSRAPDDHQAEDLRSRMRGADAFELLVEVAHDFRSPLTSILFLAEALRDGHSGPVSEIQRSQLGLIYSAAFGLASIASDVMDLAGREKDLIGDEPEPFAIAEIFGRVERMVRPLVEEKGLELRVVVPERWQTAGHSHALSRVLLNLTTNALKFTDEGSVEIGAVPRPHGPHRVLCARHGEGNHPRAAADAVPAVQAPIVPARGRALLLG